MKIYECRRRGTDMNPTESRHATTRESMKAVVRGEDGVILMIALVMLVVLSMLGVLMINLSGTNIQMAGYEKLSTQSFSSAESGLTQARNDMQVFLVASPQYGQWPAADSTVINAVMGGQAQKTYTLTIGGQPVTFTYSLTDVGAASDKTVMLVSTGTIQNVQQRIEAVIRYEPPDQTGSQECYNSECSSVDQSSGAAVTNRVNSQVNLAAL